MGLRGGLKRNVVSNLGGYVVSILIAFVLSPIIIRSLGDSRYGVWALVAQLTGYYGLLDLGIRGAISYYTARSLSRGEDENLRTSLSTGFWVLSALGAAALVIGVVVTILFPHIFRTEGVSIPEIRLSLLIMSIVIALNLPMNTLSGALVGYERLDIVNGIEVSTRVLGAVATYVAMVNGGGLVALATVQAGIAMGRWVLTVIYLRRLSGGALHLAPALVRRAKIKDLTGYGGRSMAVNLALLVINRTDLVVIGVFLGPSWVTIYTIGQMLVMYLSSAGSAVTYSFTPRLTHLAAAEDQAELERVFLLGARTAASMVAPMAGCMFAFGSYFIALWLGDQYVTGPLDARSDVIMYLLLAAHVPRVLQSISWQLLFATRRQGFLAKLNLAEAAVNLAISLVLVNLLGIVGVALGTLVPLTVTHLLFLPRYVSRNFGISIGRFLAQGVGRPVLVGGALFLLGLVLTRVFPPLDWGTFVLEAALTTAVGSALLYGFVLDEETRRKLRDMLGRGKRRAA